MKVIEKIMKIKDKIIYITLLVVVGGLLIGIGLYNRSIEVQEMEKNASIQLVEIQKAYKNKKYEDVAVLAKNFHKKFDKTTSLTEVQKIENESSAKQDEIELEKIRAEVERKRQEDLARQKKENEERRQKVKSMIRVKKIWFEMDSVGGVDVYIKWGNKSDKVIKYVTFTVTPYNAVGDKVFSHGQYDATSRLKETGPIAKGQGNKPGWCWSKVWYNSTTDTIRLEEIEIEFMDGSTESISGDWLQYVQY